MKPSTNQDYAGDYQLLTECLEVLEKETLDLSLLDQKQEKLHSLHLRSLILHVRLHRKYFGSTMKSKALKLRLDATKQLWHVTSQNYTPTDLKLMNCF